MGISQLAAEYKLERLLGTADPSGKGLEIGPRDAPLLVRPRHEVRYVDYASTEVLRANQHAACVRCDEMVEVDLVWGTEPLGALNGGPADFIVASHVVEHVPDLIGWLAELAEALRPGGLLGLVIPDKRFTFDALRKPSVVAEAVEAYLQGLRQPSLRQIFDAASLSIDVDVAEAWRGDFHPESRRAEVLERLGRALGLVRRLQAEPGYRDAHCWVFTPESFLDLAEELATLQLFPFRIDGFYPTPPGTLEFMVRLAKADPASPEIAASIAAARQIVAEAQAPGPPPEPEPEPEPDPGATEIDALTAEIERLRLTVDELQNSTSWRLTAPLRALRRGFQPGAR